MSQEPPNDKTRVIGPPAAEPAGVRVHQNALPVSTRLGEFEILDLIGEGGFGIVYLAQDHSLHRKVALKEYMPALLAARGKDASVSVRSDRQRETFEIGLRSFVNEARMLAQFDHPALVKVYRFWEANGTAYMVMPYISGRTLQDALKQRTEAPAEAWIRGLLSPLMEALAVLHADKVYHRDIAPDNILLLADDRPVLLDFGAARRVISDMTHALTVILKPGYAPIEQYADMPGMKQGPWTDVYALAAVVYFMITRRKPPAAVSRMMQDSYEPLLLQSDGASRYSPQLLGGIDRCLALRAEDRPQSMAAMREAIGRPTPPVAAPVPEPDLLLDIAEPAPAAPEATVAPAPEPLDSSEATVVGFSETDYAARFPPPAPARSLRPMLVAIGMLAVLSIAALVYYFGQRKPAAPAPAIPVAAAPVVQAPAASAVVPPPPPVAPRIATVAAAIDAALAAADPLLSATLEAPAAAPVGGELKLSVHSKSGGVPYVFVWDRAADRIHRLTPDDKDGGNAIKADAGVALRYRDAVKRQAGEPLGQWRVVAMVSEKPRDFSTTAFAGDPAAVERGALEARLAADGLSSLFGTTPCAASAPCPDRFAISVADVAQEPSVPAPAAKRAPGPKAAAPNAPGKKAADSEREYMKRLNKDLDNLLGK